MPEGPYPGRGQDGEDLPGSSPSSAEGSGPAEARPQDAQVPRRPPAAAGFADGQTADTMAPGPELARLLAGVAGSDGAALGTLTEEEVLGVIAAGRRMAAWGTWAELTALAEFGARRASSTEPAGIARGAGDEVAWKTRMTWSAASDRLARACLAAERCPDTLAALRAGLIDPGYVTVIADQVKILSPEDAAEADRLLSAAAQHKTYNELRNAAARLIQKLDPEAVRCRKEQAAKREAHVRIFREDSGNAGLAGRELPADEALASWQNIEQRALDLQAAGVDGSLRELRVMATLDLLLERDSRDTLTAPEGTGADGGEPAGGCDADGQDGDGSDGGQPDDSGPDEGPHDDSGPDEGPDDDGGRGPDRPDEPEPDEPEPDGPAGNGQAAAPGPGTGRRGKDRRSRAGGTGLAAQPVILIPWEALAGGPSGPAEIPGFGLVDPETARDLAAATSRNPRTRTSVTIIGPDGTAILHGRARGPHDLGEIIAKPADDAVHRAGPGPPDPPSGTRSTTARDLIAQLKVQLDPITRDTCDHRHAEPGYVPGRRLRHLVKARNATCSAPRCDRPAASCDLDHTIAYDEGGITCECDLAPLCRHHHRVKQADGWRLTQPAPGTLVWRTPAGLRYTTGPTNYQAL
jgi:hypothetical protein